MTARIIHFSDPQELISDKNDSNIPDLQPVSNPNVDPTVKHGSSSGIEVLPIQWNLTMVLSKSQPVELLFPMFIQNLNNGKDDKDCDKGNEDLYKEVIEKISKLHDREINLLQSDHEDFMNYLNKSSKGRKLKFPVKDPPLIRRSLSSKVSNNF